MTNETKVVRRNAHKQIAAIRAERTRCLHHAPSNGYVGVEVAPEKAWQWFEERVGIKLRYWPNQDKYIISAGADGVQWFSLPAS